MSLPHSGFESEAELSDGAASESCWTGVSGLVTSGLKEMVLPDDV